ncbi:MAG: hypothetical protein M3Y72_06320 [Acidobacteriota bacterium]|nr:hypothetical protein [Acidobacteriota bacterium]
MTVLKVLLLVFFGAYRSLSAAQACGDVSGFDFKNSTLEMGGTGVNAPHGLFGFPEPKERFALLNGEALGWQDPQPRDLRAPDFHVSIHRDFRIRPAGTSGVRVS